ASYLLGYEASLYETFSSDYFDAPTRSGLAEGTPRARAVLRNDWAIGDFTAGWNVNYIGPHGDLGGWVTHDLQVAWTTPWNGTLTVGATNAGDRYPVLDSYSGRPFNFFLYDAYGRTTYVRYTQRF